jgi:glutamine amidotransferase-like uncharacterized protein
MKPILLLLCSALTLCAADSAPLHIVLYNDEGSAGKGVPRAQELLGKRPDVKLESLTAAQVRALPWEKTARAIIFTGGSGSKQSKTLGADGVAKVRRFVQDGGGYVGICAGAYLACEGFSWGLKILDAKTVSNKWQRGVGDVKLEFTPLGKELLGYEPEKLYDIRYANGPIYMPAKAEGIPDFEPLAYFRTELAKNGSPVGVMVNSAAMVRGSFGKGRILCSSPHPEATPGMDSWLERAVKWAAVAE